MTTTIDNPTDMSALLTRAGVIVKTSVHFFRGNRQLKPEELGLPDVEEATDLFRLGTKKLNPKAWYKQFGLIESRINAAVQANTFPFMDGLFRFCPNNALPGLTKTLEECRLEIVRIGNEFKANWGQIQQDLLLDWEFLAFEMGWDAEKIVNSVRDSFPSKDSMQFGVDIMTFHISLPEEFQEDVNAQIVNAEVQETRKRIAAEAEIKMRNQTDQFVRESVAALRQEACQLCSKMLQSMESGKTAGVHQSTLDRMTNFIDYVQRMNFTGDTVLEAELNNFKSQFLGRTAKVYRSNGTALSQLRTGIQALATRTEELAREDAQEIIDNFALSGRRKLLVS